MRVYSYLEVGKKFYIEIKDKNVTKPVTFNHTREPTHIKYEIPTRGLQFPFEEETYMSWQRAWKLFHY